jgi:hypothetical protein
LDAFCSPENRFIRNDSVEIGNQSSIDALLQLLSLSISTIHKKLSTQNEIQFKKTVFPRNAGKYNYDYQTNSKIFVYVCV